MPIIAPHHNPKHPMFRDKDRYALCRAWPDDCTVQWGTGGVVLGEKPYTTAFFEAFPKSGGFIRGEGKTLEEAEADAHKTFLKERACTHVWGRRGYTNSGGKCIKCDAFSANIFAPIVELGGWKQPLTHTELSSIASGFIREHLWSRHNGEPEDIRWRRRLALRAHQAGIKLPPTPAPQVNFDDPDPYAEECMAACLDFYMAERDRYLKETGALPDGASKLFQTFYLAGLDSEARRRGMLPPRSSNEEFRP